jgi:hypothetical protein
MIDARHIEVKTGREVEPRIWVGSKEMHLDTNDDRNCKLNLRSPIQTPMQFKEWVLVTDEPDS